MDLTLSEEQLMFKKMFADFCTKEIRPKANISIRPKNLRRTCWPRQ